MTWSVQMGTIRGYSVNTPRCISRDCPPTPRWLKNPNQAQKSSYRSAMPSWNAGNGNARLRTNCKQHIRNRDNSVHRLSAVRALNFHRKRSTCVLLTSVGCERSWNPISTSIAKMQGDSGETQFTFDGNAAAPAEGISQSSPGTADSGDKSTRTTKSGWQKMTSRHRRASTTSTPRSAHDVARSGNARRSHRSPRRTPTEHRTPRAVEDKPDRESSDISAKRRSTEARGSSEPIAIIEELGEQCQT